MTIGHNSIAGDQLKSFVERIERLEEEKAGIATDIRDVYAEAKGNGFDVTTLRAMVRFRKMDPEKLREKRTFEDLYWQALGMPEMA